MMYTAKVDLVVTVVVVKASIGVKRLPKEFLNSGLQIIDIR